MGKAKITIIWQGQVLKFDDIKTIEAIRISIIFETQDMHRHTFSGVLYHIESYYDDDESLPNDAIQ